MADLNPTQAEADALIAMAMPADQFTDLGDPWQTLHDFMRYCNVVEPPLIRRGLFT